MIDFLIDWFIVRVEKEYATKIQNATAAVDKAEETYKKEVEKMLARKDDLDKQMESMLEKFKVVTYIIYLLAIYLKLCDLMAKNN